MQSTPRIAHDGPKAIAEAAAVRDAALAHHIEALEAQREAVAQLGDAKRKRAADVRAAAEKGAALPSSASIEKSEAAVALAAERVTETRNIAIGRGRSLARVVAEHADEWRRDLADAEVAAFDRLDQAVVELDEALTGVAEHLGIRTWIARCERIVSDPVASVDLPAAPPRESVLDHDPTQAVERFMAWLAGIAAALAPVDEQGDMPEADAA